jgi:DNA-binding MarR family transcriptional regulator
LSITPAGKKLETILPDKLLKHFKLFLKEFPQKDQETLLDLLLQLRITLKDMKPPIGK